MAEKETGSSHALPGDPLREAVQLHLLRNIGEAGAAFADVEAWAGVSREAGPPVDVLISPPKGERRFAYVSSFGCSVRPLQAPLYSGDDGARRAEFVLAAPQKGEETADRQMLNLAANTVRQFAKLVHLQPITIEPGETVAFAEEPEPVFEGSELVAFAFMTPRIPAPGFEQMPFARSESVSFVAPVPILREELMLARAKGPAALNDALISGGVTEMLDLSRAPVPGAIARRRRGLGGWLRFLMGKR